MAYQDLIMQQYKGIRLNDLRHQKIILEEQLQEAITQNKPPEEQNEIKSNLDNVKQDMINLDKSLGDLGKKATKTFGDLRWMVWIVFIIGLILILISIIKFIIDPSETPTILWMGSLGIADVLIVLFYNPMDRLQKASSDHTQQTLSIISYGILNRLRLNAASVGKVRMKEMNRIAGCVLNDLKVILELLWIHLEKKEKKEKEK